MGVCDACLCCYVQHHGVHWRYMHPLSSPSGGRRCSFPTPSPPLLPTPLLRTPPSHLPHVKHHQPINTPLKHARLHSSTHCHCEVRVNRGCSRVNARHVAQKGSHPGQPVVVGGAHTRVGRHGYHMVPPCEVVHVQNMYNTCITHAYTCSTQQPYTDCHSTHS